MLDQEGPFHIAPESHGEIVTALCGFEFEPHEEASIGFPTCFKCVIEAVKLLNNLGDVIDDLNMRINEILAALESEDEFGQKVWLHHVAEDMLTDALMRVGAAKAEGPTFEDGSF